MLSTSNPACPDPGTDLLQPEFAKCKAADGGTASGADTETVTGSSTDTDTDTDTDGAPALPPLQQRIGRRTQRTPEWLGAFLAGNSREKSRFKREMATIRGSVVWLVRQRRQGQWTAHERAHLRAMMRTASSVSPYLVIWVVPGSLLLLPFLAWFIDHRRKGNAPPPPQSPPPPSPPPDQN